MFFVWLAIKNVCGQYEEYPGEDYVMGVKMGTMTTVYATPQSLGAHCLHKDSLTVKDPNCVTKANNEVKKFIDRIKKIWKKQW